MTFSTSFKNKKLSASSKNWLKRQMSDPYVQQAKKQGYRSRAAFKLLDLDARFHFLKPGLIVADLGAAPGGWSQVMAQRLEAPEFGHVISIDLLPIDPITGVDILEGNFLDPAMIAALKTLTQGKQLDGVVSDMAPNTTGHRQTDHIRLIELVSMALVFAQETLKPGGFFISKLFEGGAQQELLTTLKKNFTTLKHVKPASSRKDSSEMFVVGLGYKPFS